MAQNSLKTQVEEFRSLLRQGRRERATALGRKLLARRPQLEEVAVLTAFALHEDGRHEECAASAAESLRFLPGNVDLWRVRGASLALLGRREEAMAALARALELAPLAETARNLALVAAEAGHVTEALRAWDVVVELDPSEAHRRAALEYARRMGQFEAAERHALGCIEAGLREVDFWRVLANARFGRRRFEEAARTCREGLEEHPEDRELLMTLGDALLQVGETQESRRVSARAIALYPPDRATAFRLRAAMGMPFVCDTAEEVDEARAHLEATLAEVGDLVRGGLRLDARDATGNLPYMLAYHGRDNLALRTALADLLREACPELDFTAPHCLAPRGDGPIRVGFLSALWGNSSITKSTLGFILNLDRERFHVTSIAFGAIDGEMGRLLREGSDAVVMLPQTFDEARTRLAALELDVLLYAEPNAHPGEYLLAFSRLARVQCTSIGYPETTGLPTLDHFLSTEGFDPPGFEAHYRERLVRLEGSATASYYFDPLPPAGHPRARYGLPEGPLYACPQVPYKFHPDIDALFAEILRRDPAGRLVLVESATPALTDRLKARLRRTLGDAFDRVIFLGHLPEREFNDVLRLVDVMLDPPYYSGYNTSIQALTLGTPIVNREGRWHRERHTGALLRAVGLDACVVPDLEAYVETARLLAHDTPFRAEMRGLLAERGRRLLGEEAAVLAFERFVEEAVGQAAYMR